MLDVNLIRVSAIRQLGTETMSNLGIVLHALRLLESDFHLAGLQTQNDLMGGLVVL